MYWALARCHGTGNGVQTEFVLRPDIPNIRNKSRRWIPIRLRKLNSMVIACQVMWQYCDEGHSILANAPIRNLRHWQWLVSLLSMCPLIAYAIIIRVSMVRDCSWIIKDIFQKNCPSKSSNIGLEQLEAERQNWTCMGLISQYGTLSIYNI